tara:strand:- start:246 stop:566 length:321 start_codon:yes stop_codon:yes gene_type:complete
MMSPLVYAVSDVLAAGVEHFFESLIGFVLIGANRCDRNLASRACIGEGKRIEKFVHVSSAFWMRGIPLPYKYIIPQKGSFCTLSPFRKFFISIPPFLKKVMNDCHD